MWYILKLVFNVTPVLLKASEDLLKQHYIDLKDRPFYPGLVKYMNSGPIVAMVSSLILLKDYFPKYICLALYIILKYSDILLRKHFFKQPCSDSGKRKPKLKSSRNLLFIKEEGVHI